MDNPSRKLDFVEHSDALQQLQHITVVSQRHPGQHHKGNSNTGMKTQSMSSAKPRLPRLVAKYCTAAERHSQKRKGSGHVFKSLLAYFNIDRLHASS